MRLNDSRKEDLKKIYVIIITINIITIIITYRRWLSHSNNNIIIWSYIAGEVVNIVSVMVTSGTYGREETT